MRTKDDALITVKQMVFFELRDIETMLNQTADPIADFIKSVIIYCWINLNLSWCLCAVLCKLMWLPLHLN